MPEQITLAQPLGTDYYNIGVFNSNARIIETAINSLLGSSTSENNFRFYYYPETSSLFNIDTAPTGVHICNNLVDSSLTGTYPGDDTKQYFEVFSFIKDEYVQVQLYIDMTEGHNKMYIRSKQPETGETTTTWTAWTAVGDSSGGGTGGDSSFQVTYVSELDLESNSGVYICSSGSVINGTLPSGILDTTELQLISYGRDGSLNKTQLLTSILNGANKLYSRVKYSMNNTNYKWSAWKEIGADGGGGGSNIQVSTVIL